MSFIPGARVKILETNELGTIRSVRVRPPRPGRGPKDGEHSAWVIEDGRLDPSCPRWDWDDLELTGEYADGGTYSFFEAGNLVFSCSDALEAFEAASRMDEGVLVWLPL